MSNVVYNPETGVFTWAAGRHKAGKVAGHLRTDGYIVINIDGRQTRAHRLAWEMTNGAIPEGFVVDHINCDKSDNRIGNLRLADAAQNSHNFSGFPSKTGVRNVHVHAEGCFRVRIKCRNKIYDFGLFRDLEEAKTVADRERLRLHGEFAYGRAA